MIKNKQQIITELQDSFEQLQQAGNAVPDAQFNISKENKWTAAENIQHLATSAKLTALAFTLPKVFHVLLYGKPGRTSHGYSKLVENYEKKLEGGAVASGVYVPKKTDYDKARSLQGLKKHADKLLQAIDKNWKEEQLDHYAVKHPVLGLLTVRELAYFTIYHNQHHLATIQKYYLSATR